ncbi:cysteine-rich secretory protein 2 isoform X2 [Procambarus clarkii]|uniref:cysteine-rich secretory protein 2 isoform X2 n=1 Tax=Procambarus clarkii TaxID=6728 RepID=UPI001E67025B|nr:cysteine-rich secretory protein 2-like [Procambarus clarkii]XP_045621089.1 cysteine-rich secretory protein 2-like [Procambarus clarkii]
MRWEWLLQLTVVVLVATHRVSRTWRTDRRPRLFGTKLHLRSLEPAKHSIQRKLVQFHNFFRSKVKPPASNMLAMSWSAAAALGAQRWADACQLLVHDNATGRTVHEFGACGQNIFVATHQVPWFFAVKTWWLEKDNFTYGGRKNDLEVVGHYTQMVWHSSHQVGCGLAFCALATPKPFYNYVCNYCPIGNYLQSLPRPYAQGTPCSGCPGHCKGKRLCTNSCPYGDLWINCKELQLAFPAWLCNTRSKEGLERLRHCRATCKCKGKITYP